MVEEHPLNKMFTKVMKDIQEGFNELIGGDMSELLETLTKGGTFAFLDKGGSGLPQVNPYEILGLDKSATDDEVKEQYLSIMQKIHPDHGGQQLTFLSQLVNVAYAIICKERNIK